VKSNAAKRFAQAEARQKQFSQYRSPAFGSTQGRWATQEERDLEAARVRAGLSSKDYRYASKGFGRRNKKRKNMTNM
jgi:hypothetical protein